jgi:hypothetical protein
VSYCLRPFCLCTIRTVCSGGRYTDNDVFRVKQGIKAIIVFLNLKDVELQLISSPVLIQLFSFNIVCGRVRLHSCRPGGDVSFIGSFK